MPREVQPVDQNVEGTVVPEPRDTIVGDAILPTPSETPSHRARVAAATHVGSDGAARPELVVERVAAAAAVGARPESEAVDMPVAEQLEAAAAPESSEGRSAERRSYFDAFRSHRHDPTRINDLRFITELKNLSNLKAFLLNEAVEIDAEDIPLLSFGNLNQLRYDEGGRAPELKEWNELDLRSQRLFGYLNESLRERFALSQTPKMIAWLPIVLIICALMSLVAAISAAFIPGLPELLFDPVRFVCYLVWMLCLGAIGAIAFISMNALSIQNDVTFDLANRRLLAVRIVLGSLFGVVLSIPFGFESFSSFCTSIISGAATKPGGGINASASVFNLQAALLLLPFILGFSTSLVILVLNRFVESISIFFGDRRDSSGARPSSSATAVGPARSRRI